MQTGFIVVGDLLFHLSFIFKVASPSHTGAMAEPALFTVQLTGALAELAFLRRQV